MNCQEAIDVMGDALEGRLDPTLRAGLDEHLGECTPCGTYYDHLRHTRRALASLDRPRATSPRRGELLDAYRSEFERKAD